MEDWVVWMLAAAALAVGEVFTLGFLLGPIALAALLAAGVAGIGGAAELQFVTFIVASVASLAFIRPIVRRHTQMPGRLRTGTAALVGQRALVLDRVDSQGGSVKIGGEIWTARAFDEDQVFEQGARVDVLKIEGATALVSD
jgi:membrane protein implicated in regulation of membrane protease activity